MIIESGFSNHNLIMQCFSLTAVFIGLFMLLPVVRDGFHIFPWLYPYCIILLIDLFCFGVLEMIINYGYEVQNHQRHIFFLIIGAIEIIISRIIMSIYFHKKPLLKEDHHEF